jgi:hypothetical protein
MNRKQQTESAANAEEEHVDVFLVTSKILRSTGLLRRRDTHRFRSVFFLLLAIEGKSGSKSGK